ncbi:Gfo/Idh/MocA family protein [Pseudonocardia nigra]|uniref:Gfo/Idh/MocA family protein n=1 Tax=Pseudonocardia nigra TaxID=1921578 RepID=UPI001C5E76DA|nr:Gfo/Idh/MocA family oxidoreductase [Pseudonocardia nigra]
MAGVDDLRIGVIGLGMRSRIADYAHRPGEGSRIVGVCDVDRTRVDRAVDHYGGDVAGVTTLVELLALDLDGVFVLTPDHTHEAIAVAALEAGVAAFVEKPLAITVAGADRVLDAARRTGSRLYVGHNMRHMPVILAMRDLIARGAVGEVKAIWCRHFVGHGGDFYFRDWHADRRNSTGLLLQKGAHDLDVIHWLAGAYTARVNAMGGLLVYGASPDRVDRSGQLMRDWFDPKGSWPPASVSGLHPVVDVEDLSMVHLALDNGVLASYQQCHFTPDYWRNYTVLGSAGRLENFGDTDGAVVKVWDRRSGYREVPNHVVEVPPGDDFHGGADPLMVAEFLRFVRDGTPTLTSPVAARQAVAAGCAATESLRSGGQPVDVPRLAEPLSAYFTGPPGHPSDTATRGTAMSGRSEGER